MKPRPEKASKLRASLVALVQPTRAEPGALAYDLHEEPDGSIVLVETWASQPELVTHQQQPAVRALFGDALADLLAEEMTVHYARPLSRPRTSTRGASAQTTSTNQPTKEKA